MIYKKTLLFISIALFFLFTIQNPIQAEVPKIAYLTFDDGPSHNTDQILSLLNEYYIKATFFVVGNKIKPQYYDLLNHMIQTNHYIGLHTMTHDYRKLYGKEKYRDFFSEILEEQELIQSITGFKSILIRPPYSDGTVITQKYIDEVIKLNMKLWDWNVDTEDWRANSVEEIINKVKYDIEICPTPNTLVILFHEMNITVEALHYVIDYLLDEGYNFKVYDPNHHIPVNFKQNDQI